MTSTDREELYAFGNQGADGTGGNMLMFCPHSGSSPNDFRMSYAQAQPGFNDEHRSERTLRLRQSRGRRNGWKHADVLSAFGLEPERFPDELRPSPAGL